MWGVWCVVGAPLPSWGSRSKRSGLEAAGKAAKSCPLLLPVGKWARGGRVPAQGHTAVSRQGSGARFPPRAASLPAVRVVCSEASS